MRETSRSKALPIASPTKLFFGDSPKFLRNDSSQRGNRYCNEDQLFTART